MKRELVFLSIALAAIGLVGCGSSSSIAGSSSGTSGGSGSSSIQSTSVAPLVAEGEMVAAVKKTASTSFNSFVLNAIADFSFTDTYSAPSQADEVNSIVASGSAEVRAMDILKDTAKASAVINFSASVTGGDSDVSLTNQALSGYFKEGYAYADLSGAAQLTGASSGDPTKVKTHVGNLGTFLGIDTSSQASSSELFDNETAMTFLEDMHDVSATRTSGQLDVTFTVSVDDIVDVYVDIAEMNGQMPSSYTSSQLSEMIAQLHAQLDSMITIRQAEITIGISSAGYINKLYVDLDATLHMTNTDGSSVVTSSETIVIDGSVHLDLSSINSTVSVSYPSDLDTYVEGPSETSSQIVN